MNQHEEKLLTRPVRKRTRLGHVTLGLFTLYIITYSPNIKFSSPGQVLGIIKLDSNTFLYHSLPTGIRCYKFIKRGIC